MPLPCRSPPSLLAGLLSGCVRLIVCVFPFPPITTTTTTTSRHSARGLIAGQQHDDDEYDIYRNYWQRPVHGTRVLVGGYADGATTTTTTPTTPALPTQAALRSWTQADQHRRSLRSDRIARPDHARAAADLHYDAGATSARSGQLAPAPPPGDWTGLRNAYHTMPALGPGRQPPDDRLRLSTDAGRRALNIRLAAESEFFQRQQQQQQQPWKKKAMKDIEPFAHGYDLTPISGRGSFRSDGSGQSQVRRPYSQLSYVGSNVFTVSDWERLKQPQSRLQVYHQTQPSYDSVDSSLRNRGPSSLATLSYGQQQQQLDLPWAGRTDDAMSELVRELPSLRPIHEPHHHQQFATLARSHPNNLNNNPLRATMPAARISAPQFITTRRALRRTPLEPVPEAIYDSSQQVPWPGNRLYVYFIAT